MEGQQQTTADRQTPLTNGHRQNIHTVSLGQIVPFSTRKRGRLSGMKRYYTKHAYFCTYSRGGVCVIRRVDTSKLNGPSMTHVQIYVVCTLCENSENLHTQMVRLCKQSSHTTYKQHKSERESYSDRLAYWYIWPLIYRLSNIWHPSLSFSLWS